MKKEIDFLFPIFIGKEGEWHIASCPILDIATQGKTEKEVKENMKALIEDYLSDLDTPKPNLKQMTFPSLTCIPIKLSENIFYGRTSSVASTKNN